MIYFRYRIVDVFLVLGAAIVLLSILSCSGQSLRTRQMLLSPQRELVNYALTSRGATAESPNNNPEHPPSSVIDGNVSSLDWDNGGGWEGSLSHLRLEELLKRSYIQVNLPGKKRLKQVVVYTIDSPKYPAAEFGLRAYRLEYWHGAGWGKISTVDDNRNIQTSVKDNKAGKIVHDVVGELVTDKIRLVPLSSNDIEKTYSLTAFGGKPVYDVSGAARVIEIEAWCYKEAPDIVASEEQPNLFPLGQSRPSTDEQGILEILDNYEEGYDNEELEMVMSCFSEDFSTLDGKDRTSIEEKAAKFFNDYSRINITLRDTRIDISPTGETAIAEASYTLDCVAVADGNIHRRSGSLIFSFRKEENVNWKITSAK